MSRMKVELHVFFSDRGSYCKQTLLPPVFNSITKRIYDEPRHFTHCLYNTARDKFNMAGAGSMHILCGTEVTTIEAVIVSFRQKFTPVTSIFDTN